MTIGFWLSAAAFMVIPPGLAWLVSRMPCVPFIPAWLRSATGGTLCGSLGAWHFGGWGAPAGSAVSLIVALAIWWYRRKKRRPAAALLGEKSRQLRAALVRRAREAARPRPVLQPAPRGA